MEQNIMSDNITVEQAEQQLAEAKKREEEDPFVLITHRKKDVENWGNNQSVWQVYDDLKDEDVDVRALLLKYALSYYKPEGTGYVEMLKEMASEFGIDTDES